MTVVVAGVGSEKGFYTAMKAQEHRHKVYGVDDKELSDLKFFDLVREAPACYYVKVDLSNEMMTIWELGKIHPDLVVDCMADAKANAVLKEICRQKRWEYKKV